MHSASTPCTKPYLKKLKTDASSKAEAPNKIKRTPLIKHCWGFGQEALLILGMLFYHSVTVLLNAVPPINNAFNTVTSQQGYVILIESCPAWIVML